MKQFTVVFPVAEKDGKKYILLGEQKPGKPLAGFLNGYGGKVEEGESVLECAERELAEELDMMLENPVFIGTIVHEQKQVFFYLSTTLYTLHSDTDEMVHNTWFEIDDETYISKMMPGDVQIVHHIRENIEKYFQGEIVQEFKIIKTGIEIDNATKELDKSIRFK